MERGYVPCNELVTFGRIVDVFSLHAQLSTGRVWVRHGCSLSPLLCLTYDELMISEASENLETGISVDDCIIVNTIRYADDKTVVANSRKSLKQLMDNLNMVNREFQLDTCGFEFNHFGKSISVEIEKN